MPSEWDFELCHAVHAIKQTQKMNPDVRSTKRPAEFIQKIFILHLQSRLHLLPSRILHFAKSSKRKPHHLLVALRKQAHEFNHFCQESSSICSARKSKDVDIITWFVKFHEEFISAGDMVFKRSADGLVDQLAYACSHPPKPGQPGSAGACAECPDAS